jgi:hypothetical protein
VPPHALLVTAGTTAIAYSGCEARDESFQSLSDDQMHAAVEEGKGDHTWHYPTASRVPYENIDLSGASKPKNRNFPFITGSLRLWL